MWLIVPVLVCVLGAGVIPLRRHLAKRNLQHALQLFKIRREMLEAKFFDLAAASGKPRGLRWVLCQWGPAVTFARDLETGLLTAFVAVEVHFEAIAGSDMEDVAAVGDVRNASAVFHYARGVWGTGGKVMFNMTPDEAVTRLEGQYEAISPAAKVVATSRL